VGDLPYEVHIVSFENKAGFEAYKYDPERKSMKLKKESIERMLLIEGNAL
jgi:hypothetical protein